MGLFDFLKGKEKKDSNEDLTEECLDRIMTILQVQTTMVTGSLAPLNSVPKIEWIQGYLFGHIDMFLSVSKLKDDEKAWHKIVLRVYRNYFGEEDGNNIYKSFGDLLKNKSFNDGRQVGGQDLHDYLKKGEKFPPMGMVIYLRKEYKKYQQRKKSK